jgi:hypothetical protein
MTNILNSAAILLISVSVVISGLQNGDQEIRIKNLEIKIQNLK